MSAALSTPIAASTRCCALLGRPVRHSASPAMHNAALATLGLDWRYLAFETRPDELAAAIAGAKAFRFIGLNLTVPHKLLAPDLMDALDDSAKLWGAVNTVRFEARDPRGEWRPLHQFATDPPGEIRAHGFNTDAGAIVRALREDLEVELRGASVLLLGAGGAGRVAALRLAAEGVARLFLVNRTVDRAAAVATEIRQRHPEVVVEVGYPTGTMDLVLNATSLGLQPDDGSPLDERQFSVGRARAVYDMIYRPAETVLLQTARRAGCRTANGLGMLLHQGAAALELWSGQAAPLAVMKAALEENIYGRR